MALGALVVKLALDFAQYTQGLNKSEQDALRFAKGVQDGIDRAKRATSDFLGGVVTGAVGAIASYQSIAAVIRGVSDAIDRLDQISKTAQRVGIASETLQELAYAGELADVNLEALATSSKKLSQAMLEAATGGKEQAAVFRAIGVEVKNADGTLRSSNAVMADVADVFAGMEDGALKTALAVKIFGKAGAEMIPLLNGGKKAFQEASEEARKFGLVLGNETLKNAEAFNDNITRLGKIIQGTFNQIAEGVLPILVAFSGAVVDAASDTNSLNQEAQRLAKNGSIFDWAKNAAIGLTYVMDAAEGVWRVMKGLGQLIGGLMAAASNNIGTLASAFIKLQTGDFSGAFNTLRAGVAGLGAIVDSVGADLSATFGDAMMGTKIRERIADLKQFGSAAADVGNKAKPSKALLDALADPKGPTAAQKAMDKWVEELTKYQNELDATAKQSEKLSKGEALLAQLMANNTKEVMSLTVTDRQRLRVMLQSIIASEKRNALIERERKATEDALKTHTAYIADLAKGVTKLQEEARAEEEATAEIGLSKSAIAERKAARLEEQAVILEGIGIKQLDKNSDEVAYNLYKQQAQALRERAKAMREGAIKVEAIDTLRKIDDYLDPTKAKSFGDALTDAFNGAGSALAKIGNALDSYTQKQTKLNQLSKELREAKGISQEDRIKRETDLAAAQADLQIDSYAAMAGAAKGFFEEGSKGYKTLQAAENAFRAYQLASDLVKGVSAAAVAVANQAQGDPYSAWARMAAMAAAMAALGFAVTSGGGSAPSAQARQAQTGTGTVFGDSEAKSESASRALDSLLDNSEVGLKYSQQMVMALRNIEASMSGLANIVLRTSGLTTGKNLDIQTGVLSVNKGDPIANALGINQNLGLFGLLGNSPVLGGIIKTLQGLWGKVKQEITDAGLVIQGTVDSLSSGEGVRQYADVTTTSSSFFGLKKKSTTGTQFGDVDEQIARQFGRIFENLQTTLVAAAGALGKDGELVGNAVAKFVVDIPRLSLKGLKGEELQAAIQAAISAASDAAAEAALGGFEDFQRVGEGYLETVVRVASGVEVASAALDRLGISAIAYTDIINKQGDTAAEIVRQSIVAVESAGGALSNVGVIIASIDGSSADIAEAYRSLLDLRGALRSVGETGQELNEAMIRSAGGIDNLSTSLSSYLENFFSEGERAAASSARLTEEFARIGLAVPESRAAFRALAQSLLDGTDAGAALYAKMIGLADQFNDVAGAIEDTRADLEIELLTELGRTQEVVNIQRSKELEALRALDPALAAMKESIYAAADAAAAAAKWEQIWSGVDAVITDFLSGEDLTQYRAGRVQTRLSQAGIDVTTEQIVNATPAQIRELFNAVGIDGKQAILDVYGAVVQLQEEVRDAKIAELIQGIASSAEELMDAYREINPEADTLIASWRKNKTAMEELRTALDNIAGTSAKSALDTLRETIAARDGLMNVIENNQQAALDLQVGKGGQQAVDLLKKREAELWTQFAATGSPEIAAAITKTTLDRIKMEGTIEQKALQAQNDAKFQEAQKLFDLQKEQHEAQRDAAQAQIDAAKRLQELAKTLPEFLGSLRAGSLSNLSYAGRLETQRGLFERSLETGIDPQGQLTAYLQQAQQMYGGATQQYSAIFETALAQYEAAIKDGAANAMSDIEIAQAQLTALDALAPKLETVIVDTTDRQIEALGTLNTAFDGKLSTLNDSIAGQTAILEQQYETLLTTVTNQERQITQAGAAYQALIDKLDAVIEVVEDSNASRDLNDILVQSA